MQASLISEVNKPHNVLKSYWRKKQAGQSFTVSFLIDHRAAVQHDIALRPAPSSDNVRGSDLSVSRDQFKTLTTKTAN